MTRQTKRRARTSPGSRVEQVPIDDLRPSPENDELYRPVHPDDPEVRSLADSIRQNGILEPLTISKDGYVISGHRRLCAAKLVGLTQLPVRYVDVRRDDSNGEFVVLLREHNRQREKTLSEKLREEIASADPTEAHRALSEHREKQTAGLIAPIEVRGVGTRCQISDAKQPMLDAVLDVLADRREYLPLSVRSIHYALLNNPPLRNARRPASRYKNDRRSYNDLSDLLTRARLAGEVPMTWISDETRPVETRDVHDSPTSFIRGELDQISDWWTTGVGTSPKRQRVYHIGACTLAGASGLFAEHHRENGSR